MEAMLAPVDAPLIDALRLDAPRRIADIGCGGGGTTLEIPRCAPARSVVHGFDVSPVLIEAARGRNVAAERAAVFEIADMATATPPDGPYDRLVSRFGIMFVDDPLAAFTNLAHWLAPGGRFAFAVWGPPTGNPWVTTVHQVVAEVVDVPRRDPAGPGLFRYAEADTLLALLAQAGRWTMMGARTPAGIPVPRAAAQLPAPLRRRRRPLPLRRTSRSSASAVSAGPTTLHLVARP